jgi:hypothetical protein
MSWNYRTLRRVHTTTAGDEVEYNVYEVYYDVHGNPTACSHDPVFPSGGTPEELQDDTKRYMAALQLPILDWHSFDAEDA